MRRSWILLAVVPLVACGSATKPPAPHRVATTSAVPTPVCPEVSGCEVPVQPEPRFEPPGETWSEPAPVDAPAADTPCAAVGELLAAIELGNYADPSERAPAVARGTARCEQLALDPATIACVLEQSDRASVAYCAPTMFPGEAPRLVEPRECDAVIAEIGKRRSLRPRIDHERRWWEPRAASFLRSCRTDRWTHTFAECAKESQPMYCMNATPMPLQTALFAMNARAEVEANAARAAWEAAYAEPRKHPKVKLELVSARTCGEIVRTVQKRMDGLHPGDWQRQWWAPRVAGFRRSCVRDRWPRDYGECVQEQGPHNCNAFAPSLLRQKLQVVFQQPAPKPPKPAKPPKPRRR